MIIIKIVGILLIAYILKGLHQASALASREMKSGEFHGQDPKVLKFKYAQLVIFLVILWIVNIFLVLSLLK